MRKIKITDSQWKQINEMLKISDTDANSDSITANASKTAQTMTQNGIDKNKCAIGVTDKKNEFGLGPDTEVTINASDNTNESIITIRELNDMKRKYIKEHSEVVKIKDFLKK